VPLDGAEPARAEFKLPSATDRMCVLGRTGSGKSHFAVWALSHANWPHVPWLILDYKRDPLIAEIPGLQEYKLGRKLPKAAGLYHVRANPQDNDAVEQFFWSVWKRGHTGLLVDEGHVAPDQGAMQAILSQGRSKRIPFYILSQRPVWLNRFALSEASMFAVFSMNDRRDRQTVATFLPGINLDQKLPPRHSYYYDVARDNAFLMRPVPDKQEFFARFVERAPHHPKWKVL
jgi:hypothetical protein